MPAINEGKMTRLQNDAQTFTIITSAPVHHFYLNVGTYYIHTEKEKGLYPQTRNTNHPFEW